MKAIITYHSIDDSGSVISVDADTFGRQVGWLANSGLPVVSLPELVALPDNANAIALTFDDGFENFGQVAWPRMREHGLPVTLFVVTERVGTTNQWSIGQPPLVPHLPLLGWNHLSQLAAQGVTLGSHTRTHPNLCTLSNDQVVDEIEASAETLKDRTGSDATTFAYPYGAFAPNVVQAARCVHKLACTTELRAVRSSDDALALPRLDAYYFRRAGLLERFGSARFRNYLWLRARGRGLRNVLHSGANR